MTIDIARHARRILAATRKGSVGEKVFPGYISFDGNERPAWWKDDLVPATWGRVLGVHENEPGRALEAIVVTEMGLGILYDGRTATWLRYTSIEGWDKLSKEPISRSLRVRTTSGEHFELPFQCGGAFAFVQFLSGAMREHRRGS